MRIGRRWIAAVDERLASVTDRVFFFVVWLPLLLVYLLTASWTVVRSPDPLTNAITAWELGESGSFVLDEYVGVPPPYQSQTTWIVDGPNGPVSIYPPGASILTAPIAALWPAEPEVWEQGDPRRWSQEPVDVPIPPLAPGALVAALTTSLALAMGALVARGSIAGIAVVLNAWLLGLGTGAWSVAADGLWQHGPAMFWVSLGVLLASRENYGRSGLAFGAGVLTRPPTAVIVAVLGAYVLSRRRDWIAFVKLGVGSMAGLVALVIYNRALFETTSIAGGYPDWFVEGARSTDLGDSLRQVADGLFSVERGMVVYSPFMVLQVLGITRLRGLSPAVVGSALGGLLYLVIQWKVNRFGSGAGFLGYRFPLEAVAVSSPALIASWSWIRRTGVRKILFAASVAWALMWSLIMEFFVV